MKEYVLETRYLISELLLHQLYQHSFEVLRNININWRIRYFWRIYFSRVLLWIPYDEIFTQQSPLSLEASLTWLLCGSCDLITWQQILFLILRDYLWRSFVTRNVFVTEKNYDNKNRIILIWVLLGLPLRCKKLIIWLLYVLLSVDLRKMNASLPFCCKLEQNRH